MNEIIKQKIEEVFRQSNSRDELFDAFHDAISNNIDDIDLYKILLANPILSKEEISMYSNKLSSVAESKQFDIYMWAAKLLENKTYDHESVSSSLNFYLKAAETNPGNEKPLLQMLHLYNYDLNLPTNKKIVELVEQKLEGLKEKGVVYRALASHYDRLGHIDMKTKYLRLAARGNKNQ
ncbi:MAG: hypothetical protein K9J16_15855 [Melioribacteraceae bacterium]|nr:hypothetical protein [Melioribacteraceae bacterium]MCF8356062.1 hypothetical protein [Melioribacteraceae bacterium]MCF8394889.1 hypothetical protein [Melioribacteraceae bacterium]MCF8420422.1 hypothetical protein [Melioribacteraceae bacterium]